MNSGLMFVRLSLAVLSAGVSLNAVSAMAQEEGAAPSTSSDFGEIIVTAQRKDESLSETPVAVAVVSSDTLAKAQVVTEQDLRFATPGLQVRATNSSNQLNYSLRGQSQDAYSGTRPGVLPYINEVQVAGVGGGSTAFYDLQSVQVLKGPQGTLFGRSATGGAVLFQTAKPTEELDGYVSALAGNYNALKFEAAIGGPIVGESVLGRVAGFYHKRDGFQKNLYNGEREGDVDRWGIRGSLTVNTGPLKNELMVDYFRSTGENTEIIIGGLLPYVGPDSNGAVRPPYIPLEALYAGVLTPQARATGIATVMAFTGQPESVVAPFYDSFFANPKVNPGGLRKEFEDQQKRGPYVVNGNANNDYLARNIVITNATTLELSDSVRLKNIFGYVRLKQKIGLESDGSPFTASGSDDFTPGIGRFDKTEIFSNEIQLQGTTLNDRLDFVTGFYFSKDKNATFQRTHFFDVLFGGPLQDNDFEVRTRTLAAFGQGTYKLTDNGLSATVGLRYTSEKQRTIMLPGDSVRIALGENPPPGIDYDQSRTFKNLSWTFGVQYQVDRDLLLYIASRRSFKAGGFNGQVTPIVGSAETGGNSYEEERVTDVELGLKYAGRLGGVPVRTNLALFRNWVDNSQRTAYVLASGNPAPLTVNVPKGKVYGAEFDAVIRPASWLSFGGTINYTKASYPNGNVTPLGNPQVFDIVPDTPKISGTVFADLTFPVTNSMNLLLHGDLYGQSKTFTTPQSTNSFGTRIPGYEIANFRVGVEDPDAGWSLTANLKNAFNKIYYAGGIPTGNIYQLNMLLPGEPRTFTVEARFNF